MPAAATTQPCRVSHDPQRAAAGDHAHRLVRRSPAAGPPRGRRPARPRTSRPSTLETTLEVTTTTSPSASHGAARGDRGGQVVAGRELGQPGTGCTEMPGGRAQAPAASRAARARAAVASGEDISSGTRRTSTPGTSAVSLGRDQPGVEQAAVRAGAVVPADALGAHLDAEHGQAAVGHAAHDGAADDRGDADDPARAWPAAPRACPGTPRIVPIETTGLDGASRTASAAAKRLRHAGRRPRRVDADLDEGRRVAARRGSRTHHSWKWIGRAAGRSAGRRRRRGSRPAGRSSAAR